MGATANDFKHSTHDRRGGEGKKEDEWRFPANRIRTELKTFCNFDISKWKKPVRLLIPRRASCKYVWYIRNRIAGKRRTRGVKYL